jgi:hypothetical protein
MSKWLNEIRDSQLRQCTQFRQRDSRTSRATQCGVTPSATSDATFSNATVDISRATSCGVTQVLVAPRGLARQKWLLLGILVGVGLVLKF